MRAGLVPFPISPRTPAEGTAHLLSTTRTSRILTSSGPAVTELHQDIQKLLLKQDHKLESFPIPSFKDLYRHSEKELNSQIPKFKTFPTLQSQPSESPVIILHSSGSTGLPRAVVYDHEGIFKNIINQRGCSSFLSSYAAQSQPVAMFHPIGGPNSRAGTMSMPSFHAATWAKDDNAIATLRKLKIILCGGGPLAEQVGDYLVEQRLKLQTALGATEFGSSTHPCYPGYDPRDWIYLKFSDRTHVHFAPQYDEQNSHELIFVAGPNHKPLVINAEIDGKPAYSTKDLVVPHPAKPELWRLVGRADDQITLSNGEKINPGPMENTILKSPFVQIVAVFGREKNHTGVLIELVDDKIGTSTHEIIDNIWPYIEQANALAPTHGRLARDTVIFSSNTKPLPRTPKGNVSRTGALKAYSEEIENMYANLERSGSYAHDVGAPETWKETAMVEAWVRSCVEKILGREVKIGGDLFQQGMDSLSAAILLRIIKSSMHASSEAAIRAAEESISRNMVFTHPTVNQLSSHLVHLCVEGSDQSTTLGDDRASVLDEMKAMIQKYGSNWSTSPAAQKNGSRPTREVVVLTGGTGGLGCYLLATLLADVMSTRSGSSIGDLKLLDIELLEHPKLSILEANLESVGPGLAQEAYEEIQATATTIIHNAWQVNFNLTLQSFEPSIKGTRNLLELAFNPTAPTGLPRFVFTSSVSAAGFRGSDEKLEEKYISLEHGVNSIGYGRSKLVAERLLESARASGLETCIIRLGQLTGDKRSRAWSINDWVPAMIVSSVSAGCLPTTSGHISWIPLDSTAQAMHEVYMNRSAIMPTVIHCAHPRPTLWSDVLGMFSKALVPYTKRNLALNTVPISDWNRWIIKEASAFHGPEDQKYQKYPTTKIQGMFDGMTWSASMLESDDDTRDDVEMGGTVALDMTEALALSQTLRSVPKLDQEIVEKWVLYWGKNGLFD
ncbi:hypothetical protein FRC12_020418 [Ceratobasidium sp. 428]|nr:hypothetical protein FRC12_020418 [Ceratobasidium sp. 428]